MQVIDRIQSAVTNGSFNEYGDLIHESLGNDLDIEYRVDALGRRTEVIYPDRKRASLTYEGMHLHQVAWKTYTHTYLEFDLSGKVCRMRLADNMGECQTFYDNCGRATLRVLGLGLGAEIGAAVFIDIDGVVSSPVHDQSGNLINLIAHGTERLLASYQYSAFGVVEKHDGLDSPWQFSSKRVDPETGWIYFGRRYYDPALGRWTTCDSEGDNLYAYVYNNPLTHFDMFGLFDGYWDMDADEAAMYDRDAYMEGFNYAMSTLAGGARDFLFGST